MAEIRIQKIIADVLQMLTQIVVPLYRVGERDRPEAMGTGFLIHDNGAYFLISAAHCLEETKGSGGLYFYYTPKKWRKVSGRVMVNPWKGDRVNDPVDVGVVKLDGNNLPPYPEMGICSVGTKWLRPKRTPRTGKRYAIVGYPASYVEVQGYAKIIRAKPFAYHYESISDSEYSEHEIDPESNIALRFEKKKSFLPDGKQMISPDPQGLSGAPIFELWDYGEKEEGDVFPIVAVGTKHRKQSRFILGTDVSIVMDMIAELNQ